MTASIIQFGIRFGRKDTTFRSYIIGGYFTSETYLLDVEKVLDTIQVKFYLCIKFLCNPSHF